MRRCAARGEANGAAKLTDGKVVELRRLYRAGGVSLRALAAEEGVHHSTTGRAIRGDSWAHVECGA
jgi:hypothetical protein